MDIEDRLEEHIADADYAAAVAENRRFHQSINRIADVDMTRKRLA